MLATDLSNTTKELLHNLITVGFFVSLYLAVTDEEYTAHYDMAYLFIELAMAKSQDLKFKYTVAQLIQGLVFGVRKALKMNRLGESQFNNPQKFNELMELAQTIPITEYRLQNINYKLKEMYPKTDIVNAVPEVEKLIEELNTIKEEPDHPQYLSTKVGVYT